MSANSASLTVTSTMTNAEFQAIMQFIANVMQSGGLTKTADTGQIDTATAAFPGSNDTYAGYEIRAFSDSLQATDPVFFKIEYGRGGGAANFAIRMTWGTGSNGTGTITGAFTGGGAAHQIRLVEGAGSYTNCVVSAGTCRFGVAFQTATALNAFYTFERTITAARVYTNEAVMVMPFKSGQILGSRVIPRTGTQPTIETTDPGQCLPPMNQTTGLNADGNVAIYPYFFQGIGKTYVPGTMAAGCFATDFTIHNSYTCNVLGTDQTMIRLAAGSGSTNYMQRGSSPSAANFVGLMRYE